MNYEQLENEIRDRLMPLEAAGIHVRLMPEVEDDLRKNLPAEVTLTIVYAGSEYPSLNSTAQVYQNEAVFISILVESTFLRGTRGIYNMISVLKQALIGFQPYGCTRIIAVKHHTIGTPEAHKINNMWNYQVIFQTTSVAVENYQEDLSVILKKITLQSQGETIIIPPITN